MPLTSKNNGPELQVGDLVWMDWIVARLFAPLDAALVMRQGPDGSEATLPPSDTRAVTVRASASAPPAALVGAAVALLWRVARVFVETGTVLVERDGIERQAGQLVPVTLSAGALAADLLWADPTLMRAATAPVRPFTLDDGAFVPEPDMLPYGYEPAVVIAAPPLPVAPTLTALQPAEAQLGTPSFTLHVLGNGFKPGAVIVFAGQDEPTTIVSGSEVTTGVNMAVWAGPDVLPVYVRQDGLLSNSLSFTFTPAAAPQSAPVEEPAECATP